MIRALLLGLPLTAFAAEAGGVNFPERWQLDGQTLLLNGAGVREYGPFGIDVYAAALYLRERETQGARVLDSPLPKVVQMRFLRDVSRADTLKAWDAYFERNCVTPCVLPYEAIAAFRAFIPDARDGDTQTYRFYDGRVEIDLDGQRLGSVKGAAFARLLLSTWIGDVPTTAELKAALLGIDR